MALSLYAVNDGYLDDVPVNKIGAFESALHAHFDNEPRRAHHPDQRVRRLEQGHRGRVQEAGIEEFKRSGSLVSTNPSTPPNRASKDMAGGREIKTKIKSVQNTRKVTRALEMVSASKIARRRTA
jgi:hypothetical protein